MGAAARALARQAARRRARGRVPASTHVAYLRRMSPLADTYTKERAVPVCLDTLTRLGFDLAAEKSIRLDLDDRPQKNPRACVIASDPPTVVHLITRAQGRLHDYQALLHEAGHALHYAGCDPALPYAFRRLSRDHALTEIYSFLVESMTREPGWHAGHFSLVDGTAEENAESTRFLEALLFRRYAAKLALRARALGRLRERAGLRGHVRRPARRARSVPLPAGQLPRRPRRRLLLGRLPARVDPLGPAAGVPARDDRRGLVGAARDGRVPAELFLEGTRPSSEEVARRIGFEPFDTGPLLDELAVAA